MRFTSLRLARFRNYDSLELSPHPGITVLYGPNGSGKTNLLEAMHLLSVGRSHRTANDREMIAAGANVALVHGQTRRLDGAHEVEDASIRWKSPRSGCCSTASPPSAWPI